MKRRVVDGVVAYGLGVGSAVGTVLQAPRNLIVNLTRRGDVPLFWWPYLKVEPTSAWKLAEGLSTHKNQEGLARNAGVRPDEKWQDLTLAGNPYEMREQLEQTTGVKPRQACAYLLGGYAMIGVRPGSGDFWRQVPGSNEGTVGVTVRLGGGDLSCSLGYLCAGGFYPLAEQTLTEGAQPQLHRV